MTRNWHAIEGPNGMCACGVRADGAVVTCGALFREELEASLATQAQQWQPIETAPKDGTEVLLLWHDGVSAPMFDVGYNLGDGRRWQNTHDWLHNERSWPTHWAKLLAPPVLSGEMRKPVRGRFLAVVPLDGGGSFRVETDKDASRTPRQIVEDLRHYADFIEKHFVRADPEDRPHE